MRRWSLVVLVACGSGSAPAPAPAPARDAAPVTVPHEPSTGAHGAPIVTIAVTADGAAAVSSDALGSLRLWPALDGTREPVVFAAAAARALAITRDGTGFAVAVTDAAGHVQLVRLDRDGRVHARTSLGEASQLELVADTALLLRPDQVIEQLAFDGTVRARLVADAGTTIASLAVRDGRALAIVAGEDRVRARWLERAPLAWGRASATLPIVPGPVAIAPDGTQLVALAANGRRAMTYDLATGEATRPACPAPEGRVLDGTPDVMPLGVVGDDWVACLSGTSLVWWNLVDGAARPPPPADAGTADAFAAADGRIVVAHPHQLGLYTPDKVAFLGYGVRELDHLRGVPGGLMLGTHDRTSLVLDAPDRARATLAVPAKPHAWADAIAVGEDVVLATTVTERSFDPWTRLYQVAMHAPGTEPAVATLPYGARTAELVYEPATGLLATSDGERDVLVAIDVTARTFGERIVLETPFAPTRVALVDPALADGTIALALRQLDGSVRVAELHRDDVRASSGAERVLAPRRIYDVPGQLAASDRAGKLYLRDGAGGADVQVQARDHHVGTLAGVASATLRPSPDGTLVAAYAPGEHITLLTTGGVRRWETAAWELREVGWLRDGSLFARFPGALATLDPAHGTLAARQCGWAFGLSDTPYPAGVRLQATICDDVR